MLSEFKSDIQIAQEAKLKPVEEIAKKLDIAFDNIELYGKYKAKISPKAVENMAPNAKLILVTAINPTPAGEGKTTISVGLADGLAKKGKKVTAALREPSLGPVFGVKGGAAGGGYAQVVPMEDLNLHFTGDIHAVTTANNLLAAMLDNHINFGNKLRIDIRRIQWHRCMDMNDRQLRFLVNGLGGKANGMPREDSFDITAASEIMAVLCMAKDLEDLKRRLGDIVVGYNDDNKPVTARDLNAQGAMTSLLKDALKPNLVQTLEGTPVLIHGGPFANIAHGCNSIIATKTAMCLSDYVVTEAGFGADLGAEKFLDIKCRYAGLTPSAVVLVATVKALKYHGGVPKTDLKGENVEALKKGLANLGKHIENITTVYNLPVVVAANRFYTDTQAELDSVIEYCRANGTNAVLADVWAQGGNGALALADAVISACETPNNKEFTFSYETALSVKEKISAIATKIYGASGVEYSPNALKSIEAIENNGYGSLPICIAKTQYSLSDNPALLGRPKDFKVSVRDARISAGAGFVVILTGEIMTMPGLPRVPAAEAIDVDQNGVISGLF